MPTSRNEADRMFASIHRVAGHPVLPPCIVLGCIGQGGMAVVYRGWHLNLGIDVAIKCMRPSLLENAGDFVDRFRREGQSAARINHQNVIRLYDVAEHQGLHYMIMELIEGETARQRVARKGALPIGEAVQIFLEAARGLGEAHLQGMVHRDIKPENLLVSRKGQVKVADLGLAKPAVGQGFTLMSAPDVVMGTPHYMPPEQWDGPNVTPAADVWALGATFWHALVGSDAIRGDAPITNIMSRICNKQFPDVRTARPDVPAAVADLIRTATANDPSHRFANAAAMAEAIEALGIPRASLRDDFDRAEEAPTLVSRPSMSSLAAIKDWLRQGAITPDRVSDDEAPADEQLDDEESADGGGGAAAPRAGGTPARARKATSKVRKSAAAEPAPPAAPSRVALSVAIVTGGLLLAGAGAALYWDVFNLRATPTGAGGAGPVASEGPRPGATEPQPTAGPSPTPAPSNNDPATVSPPAGLAPQPDPAPPPTLTPRPDPAPLPTDDRELLLVLAKRRPLGADDARRFADAAARLRQSFEQGLQVVAPSAPVARAGSVPFVVTVAGAAGDRLSIDGKEVAPGADGRYATDLKIEGSRDVEVALRIADVELKTSRRVELAPVALAQFLPVQGKGPWAPRERAGLWLVGDRSVRFALQRSDDSAVPEFRVDGIAVPSKVEDGAFVVELPAAAANPCSVSVVAKRPADAAASAARSVRVRRIAVSPSWRMPAPGANGSLSFRERSAVVEVDLGVDAESAAIEVAGVKSPLAPIGGREGVFGGAVQALPGTKEVRLTWQDVLGRTGGLTTAASFDAPRPSLADLVIDADGRATAVEGDAALVVVQGPQVSLRFTARDAGAVELAVDGKTAASGASPLDLSELLPRDRLVDLQLVARGDGGESAPVAWRMFHDATPPSVTVAPERLELPAGSRGAVVIECSDAGGIRGVWCARRGESDGAAVPAAADGTRRIEVAAPTSSAPVDYEVRVEDNAGRTSSRAFTVVLAAPAVAPMPAPSPPPVTPSAKPPSGFRAAKGAEVNKGLLTAIVHEGTGIVLDLLPSDSGAGPALYYSSRLVRGDQFDPSDAAVTPKVSIGGDQLRGWFNDGRGAGLRLPSLSERQAIARRGRVANEGKKEWLQPSRWNATQWPVFEPQTGNEVMLGRNGNAMVGFRVVVSAR
jgi:serine/threonine-protein kinase